MLAHPIATAALFVLGSGAANAATTPKQKMDFMRAMKTTTKKANRSRKLNSETHKKFKAELYGKSKASAALRAKVMSKSKVTTEPGQGRKLDGSYNNYNAYEDYKSANGYNNNNANANAYNGNNANSYSQNAKDTDDYFAATGVWNNQFGFDVTQYSLSYHRCASVRQFDDELAAQDDTTSVFSTKQFAVFRFCPEATCMGQAENDYQRAQEEWTEQQYEYQQQQNGGQDQEEQEANAWYNQICYNEETGAECELCTEDGKCDEEVFGARSEGCQKNYGEYMIELEDYLQMMLEWQGERFETYCTYCEECMWEAYQAWLEEGGTDYNYRNRKLVTFDDFQASNKLQEEAHRNLGGNLNGGLSNPIYYEACPEYDTCSEYLNICEKDQKDDLTEYFECTEVEGNNGQISYLGPHCHANGFSVTLGVYSDEYCNEYIGDGVDISKILGYDLNIEDDALKSWYNSANGALDILEFSNEDDVCIPCRKGDMPYEDSEYVVQSDDEAEYYMNPYGDGEINEICESLYQVSARCDKHFRSYSTKSKQAKYAEAVAQEDLSCDFIQTIVMGNYNEMGFLNLSDDYTVEGQPGWMGNSMYAQQYGHYITEVTPLQVFGLLASIAACLILAGWSNSLHASLSKRGPWRPRSGFTNRNVAPQDDVARQSSGIVMGRSQSNASYYMS